MADYILVDNSNRSGSRAWAVPAEGQRSVTAANPYQRAFDPRDIAEDATPWQIWFHAVDALDTAALMTRVPESFRGIVRGEDRCPSCGGALAYAPGRDRYQMELSCPACGGTWCAVDAAEHERQELWARWQQEHGEPRSLSEYWAMQAAERGEDGGVDSLIEELGL